MKPLGWRAQCAIWAFQVVLVAFLVPCGKIPDKKQLQRGRTLLRTHSEATGQRGGEGMVAERLLRPLGSEAAGPPVPSETEQGTMELAFVRLLFFLLGTAVPGSSPQSVWVFAPQLILSGNTFTDTPTGVSPK